MVTCQSANQLKTPAKVSWAFKMVSQFGSLGYTIMGKTADLTVVQKTIIDTLHKEGKPQTFIAKEAGCSQSAVSKHVNRKLSGRKKCGRKRCTTNRENRSLMRIVKQNRFKNLGELHKEWTEAGVKASRATTHRHVKEFGYSCRIPLFKPLKGVAVYRVLYQSILNAKLTGRKNLGRKRCTSNRDDRKLENTVKQSWFKHLGELHKEWTEAGVSASRVTTLRRLQEKGYQATSEPETTSEASYLGCGEKELDCCSVVQSPLFRWK